MLQIHTLKQVYKFFFYKDKFISITSFLDSTFNTNIPWLEDWEEYLVEIGQLFKIFLVRNISENA